MKEVIPAKEVREGDVVYRFGVSVGRTVDKVVDTGNSVIVQYKSKTVEYSYTHSLTVERLN